jgi:hypothetical protein
MCGRYYSEGIEPNSFSGWVRAVSARGFTALDIGSNAQRVERTYQDVRRDGADHYFALFPARGQLAMLHTIKPYDSPWAMSPSSMRLDP